MPGRSAATEPSARRKCEVYAGRLSRPLASLRVQTTTVRAGSIAGSLPASASEGLGGAPALAIALAGGVDDAIGGGSGSAFVSGRHPASTSASANEERGRITWRDNDTR